MRTILSKAYAERSIMRVGIGQSDTLVSQRSHGVWRWCIYHVTQPAPPRSVIVRFRPEGKRVLMLSNPSEQIADCHRRAAEWERQAKQQTDPARIRECEEAAQRWRRLAGHFEFTEQLMRFMYRPIGRKK